MRSKIRHPKLPRDSRLVCKNIPLDTIIKHCLRWVGVQLFAVVLIAHIIACITEGFRREHNKGLPIHERKSSSQLGAAAALNYLTYPDELAIFVEAAEKNYCDAE